MCAALTIEILLARPYRGPVTSYRGLIVNGGGLEVNGRLFFGGDLCADWMAASAMAEQRGMEAVPGELLAEYLETCRLFRWDGERIHCVARRVAVA